MATISYQVLEDSKQINGYRNVRVEFTDSEGGVYGRSFQADPGQDLLSTLVEMGQKILESQVLVELEQNMQEAVTE